MRLSTVEIENFRAVGRLKLPLHERLNVLVGDNAAGKTSVIEAIAIGLGAILEHLPDCKGRALRDADLRVYPARGVPLPGAPITIWIRTPFVRVALHTDTDTGLAWDRIKRRDRTRSTAAQTPKALGLARLQAFLDPIITSVQAGGDADLPIVAYYGTERAVPAIPQRKRAFRATMSRFAALDGALDAGFRFKDVFEWLVMQEDLERREKESHADFGYKLPVLEAVRNAVERGLDGCRRPRTELNPLRLVVDLETPTGGVEQLALDQLSGGYRTMLTLVIDLARRMAQANPHRGGEAIDAPGIVLIDEVDLHLHPRWQQRVVHDLQRAFPNIQFIVSTHSPQVLTTVKPESILILEREAGRISAAVPTSSYGAKSGRLLTEILGVEQEPPAQVVDFTRLMQRYGELIAQDRGEAPEALALRQQLEQLSPHEPELLRMDLEIRRRRVLRRAREAQA
jgi:predicted ATP-binding protein involved in virulence